MSEEQIAGTTQNTGENAPAAATPTTPESNAAPAGGTPTGEQQATESQQAAAAQDNPADAPKAEGDSDKPQGAPESYEFKAPEGIVLDDAVIGEFSTVAKELGLTQDAAQTIVEKLAPKIAERTAAQQAEAFANYRAELAKQAKTDKEFGGDKFDANSAVAKKALDAFGTPELSKLLNESGLGDHPEVIRAFYRAGKAISQDGFVPGGMQPTKGEQDAATKLYGSK